VCDRRSCCDGDDREYDREQGRVSEHANDRGQENGAPSEYDYGHSPLDAGLEDTVVYVTFLGHLPDLGSASASASVSVNASGYGHEHGDCE